MNPLDRTPPTLLRPGRTPRATPGMLALALIVAASAVGIAPAAAVAQEVQVALDEEGRVLEIDRDLARRIGVLLDRYPELEVARLFQLEPERFVLEVTYSQDGRTARRRVPMTADEVTALRARVTRGLAASAPEELLDQDGRFLLLGTTTYLGLAFYGWAVPVTFSLEGQGAVATYMLTAGASFVLPYLYTRDRPVSYGMANAGFWGATRGIGHGLMIAGLLSDDADGRFALGLATTTSLAEALAGYGWAVRAGLDAGDAHTIGNYGDFGQTAALAAMLTLQPRDDEPVLAALLAGSGLGLAWGANRYPALGYSWGDAEIQRAATYLGAANGGVVFDWLFGENADEDEVRILGSLLLGGGAASLLLANRALEGKEFSAGEGILVDLGTLAGGLLGLGVAYLVSDDDATPYFTLGALGADLGFLLTFVSLQDEAERRHERLAPRTHLDRLDLQVNPAALFLLDDRASSRFPGGAGLPLVSLSYRF